MLLWQNQITETETTWPLKPHIFNICPFTETMFTSFTLLLYLMEKSDAWHETKVTGLEHIPWSMPLSGYYPSHSFLGLWMKSQRFGTVGLNGHTGTTWVLLTHRVRWLNPTVLNVNALARSRTCVKITPIASSNSVSFCRTGEVSISCRSVFGSCSYREREISKNHV